MTQQIVLENFLANTSVIIILGFFIKKWMSDITKRVERLDLLKVDKELWSTQHATLEECVRSVTDCLKELNKELFNIQLTLTKIQSMREKQ
jgi:hypothetical protein